MKPRRLAALVGIACVTFGTSLGTQAQQPGGPATGPGSTTLPVNGVRISADGVISSHVTVAAPKLSRNPKDARTAYVSLPRLFADLKRAREAGNAVPRDLQSLGGLTQITHVFVYPDAHDIVLSGPAEPVDTTGTQGPRGKITGRPALQLDDLVVILRTVYPKRETAVGCSIDLTAKSLEKSAEVIKRLGPNASDAQLESEIAKSLGPQDVRVFGVPDDSRVSLAMVAADYRLKQWAMAGETMPVPGVGSALGTGKAASRVWFAPQYDPLLVSVDGLSYELRGPRLRVDAGAKLFESKDASALTARFAKNFTDKMPQIAAKSDAIADLQNIADLIVVSALLSADRLPEKADVDFAWILDSSGYRPHTYTAPKKADTLVKAAADTVSAGGVLFTGTAVTSPTARKTDDAGTLAALRNRPTDGAIKLEPAPAAR